MKSAGKKKENDVVKEIGDALIAYDELVRDITEDSVLHRTQPSKYDETPINYKRDSETRYADPKQQTGVFYLGCSDKVAMAESYQPGDGDDNRAVKLSRLEGDSIHRYKPVRTLKVIDAVALVNRTSNEKLRDLVKAKGKGARGYKRTRDLSHACMRQGDGIDGILYPSAVYSVTGSMEGCNLVLFEGRGAQVEPIDYKPVAGAKLSNGELVEEFLESLGVVLE